jgi:PAS domain S-box-containing protein
MPELEGPQVAAGFSIESCQTGVLVCDRRGQIRWASAAMGDILGYPEGELVTMNLEQALGPESHVFAVAFQNSAGPASVRGAIAVTGRDGRIHHCDLLAVGQAFGDPDAVQISVTDVSKYQQLEGAARRLTEDLVRTLGPLTDRYEKMPEIAKQQDFLSSVCYEVQIAAEAVAGYIELLAADLQQPAASLSNIHSRVRRLSTVMADLADVAAAGSEERRLQLETVDLEDIVENAASTVYTEALRKEQRLVIDIDEEARMVSADPSTLQRLLIGLLAHAVRATPARGTVRVSARRSNGSRLVGVSDAGLPIEDDDLPHVLRPFANFHPDELWVERPADGGNTVFFSMQE